MASMLGRVALRSFVSRRSGVLLQGTRNASGAAAGGGVNAIIVATGVGVLGITTYAVSDL